MSFATVRRTYTVCDLPFTPVKSETFLSGECDDEITKRIRSVIKEEAPVTEWLLIKRVINSFGLYKAGEKIREHMDQILHGMKLNAVTDGSGTVYFKAKQKPGEYREYRLFGSYDLTCRDILCVPDAEIANAAASVCENESMEYEDLARQTAALLGYTRMGTNVRDGMKRGISCAKKTKRITVKNGKYIN